METFTTEPLFSRVCFCVCVCVCVCVCLCLCVCVFFRHTRSTIQCHGLWDEDDQRQQKRGQAAQEMSEDEGNSQGQVSEKKEKQRDAAASSVKSETQGSLRSLNFDGPVDSVQVQMHHTQQKTFQRRKSSSGGSYISHLSGLSSARSKRGKAHPCVGMDGWMDERHQFNGAGQHHYLSKPIMLMFSWFIRVGSSVFILYT